MRCSAADQTTAHGNTRQMAMRLAIFCSVVIGAGRSGEGSFGRPLMLRRNDCRAVKPRRSISALAGRRKAQTLAIAQQQRLAVAKSCQIQLRLTLYPQVGLATTRPTFPAILGLRIANGLPLHIGNRVRAAAGERDDVIFTVAGAGTTRPTFPAILGLRIANGLPLHIGNRVRGRRRRAGRRDLYGSRGRHRSYARWTGTGAPVGIPASPHAIDIPSP